MNLPQYIFAQYSQKHLNLQALIDVMLFFTPPLPARWTKGGSWIKIQKQKKTTRALFSYFCKRFLPITLNV